MRVKIAGPTVVRRADLAIGVVQKGRAVRKGWKKMVAMERVPQLGTINVLVVKILSYESIRSIIDVSKINMTTSIWTRKFYDHKKCFKKILCTAFFHPESTIERAISGAEKRKKSFLLLLSFSATLIPCSAQTVVETKVASCARIIQNLAPEEHM